jgi:hypothetical protein
VTVQPYEEIVEFIASLRPREIVEFKPSEEARATEDKVELDHYLEVEHLMRLAKARARQLLAHEQRG